MKMADKQLIDQDNARAQQIADQQQAIRNEQRRIMRDENLQLMNQKKNLDEMGRVQEKSLANTSPV